MNLFKEQSQHVVEHHYQDLINIFNGCFVKSYNTQLIKGEQEPIYLPATEGQPHHAILFAHGYFSSALHECSHWLIAGEARRLLVDFGYWYYPDGRNAEQQSLFQTVEVKPQALEWILSKACSHPFRISADNLDGAQADTDAFKQAVYLQVLQYCEQGLNKRAALFRNALCDFYNQSQLLSSHDFSLDQLW